jgi:hypothetical protein
MVVHAYNYGFSGGRYLEKGGSWSAQAKKLARAHLSKQTGHGGASYGGGTGRRTMIQAGLGKKKDTI